MRKIAADQRFRKTDSSSSVWKVLDLLFEPGGIRYLWLSSIDDPTKIKLISVSTLTNEKLYHLVNETLGTLSLKG
jgi:hypothetical protein